MKPQLNTGYDIILVARSRHCHGPLAGAAKAVPVVFAGKLDLMEEPV